MTRVKNSRRATTRKKNLLSLPPLRGGTWRGGAAPAALRPARIAHSDGMEECQSVSAGVRVCMCVCGVAGVVILITADAIVIFFSYFL